MQVTILQLLLLNMKSGFTVIEILVVISIVAIVGTVTLANFRSFGTSKELENASFDIQSILRVAQTNATTNLKCNNQATLNWITEFSADKKTINLKCQNSSGISGAIKTLSLGNNLQIINISTCSFPVSFNFAPLYGTFSSPCDPNSNMQIVLKNSKTGETKNLMVEKGGRIYVQ